MARVPYPNDNEIPDPSLVESAAGTDVTADHPGASLASDELNVYRVMANNPELIGGFRSYAGTLWDNCDLSPRKREFAILATAAELGVAYEWHQHVRVALGEGVTSEEIIAVSNGELNVLDSDEAAIVEYVSQVVDGSVDEMAHERIATVLNDSQIVALCQLIGLYSGLGRLIEALDIDTEVEFVGWDLENLS